MSFYWASGGMMGVRSLGGVIYKMALEKEASFIALIWLTGFAKLCAGVFLLLFLRGWPRKTKRVLCALALIGGVFLFLYGLTNLATLGLSGIGILSLKIDHFAQMWRMLFWEPFWMLGGVFFIGVSLLFKDRRLMEKGTS